MTRPEDVIEDNRTGTDRTLWVELAAEQAAIVKRRKTLDTVQVTTRTQTRDVVIDEPLTSETVTVERVAVGRYVDAIPEVRQDGDVTVMPVVDEEVVVTRRLFLREEVRVHRARVLSRHVETVSLREQVANVSRIAAEPRVAPTLAIDVGMELPTHTLRRFVMDEETIVAVYDTAGAADAALGDLRAANVPESAISRHSGTSALTTEAAGHDVGFWSGLFGSGADHHDDAAVYNRSVSAGSSVVAVRTPAHDVEAVLAILERHSPIDIDERAAEYALSGSGSATGATMGATTGATMGVSDASTRDTMTTGAAMTAATGMTTGSAAPMATGATTSTGLGSGATGAGMMQLSEEQIAVGKRVINRGGTRIRRYVVETPIEETVSLRDEKVTLERRPVTDGRPVTDASFTERTIEMTETAEEAVVSKTARVVEEVGLRKEATERTETIRDTVRKEEVDVEQVPGEVTRGAATTNVAGSTTTATTPKAK